MSLVCLPIMVEPGDGALERAAGEAHDARAAGADFVEFRIDAFVEHVHDHSAPTTPSPPGRGTRRGTTGAAAESRGTHGSANRAATGEFDHSIVASIASLVADSPLPVIVTCRTAAEGGAWSGDDADRASLYRALADAPHPPTHLDIEFASLERSASLAALARDLSDLARSGFSAPRIIASLHDFSGRPEDLTRRLARLRDRVDVAVIKIALYARSLRDNLELFEILESRDRPTIALGMGEFGLMSRILAPKFGAFLTFASLRAVAVTAPGQPAISDLLERFRFRSIAAPTKVFGVIGWPIAHSRSPIVHNAAFQAAAFDGVYLPLPIPPEWEHFKATLGALTDDPRLDFAGASVTIPHKEHLVRFARECEQEGWSLDDLSSACGAGNTLIRDEIGWQVLNTDGPAIVGCLRAAGAVLKGARVLILGAGGVARAAAAGLLAEGALVMILNRHAERAERLVRKLALYGEAHGGRIELASFDGRDARHCSESNATGNRGCSESGATRSRSTDFLSEAPRTSATAIINATPVGMTGGPDPDRALLDLRAIADAGLAPIMFDTVYSPPDTPFLREARSLGFPVVDGVSLFARQAELQFLAFTRRQPPVGLFERLVRQSFSTP